MVADRGGFNLSSIPGGQTMPKAVLLPHAPPHPLYFLVGEGLKSESTEIY